jgi:hypothetical protein
MAKTPKSDQHGRIKVRVIELEMEGSDDSIQEGLKSLAAALGRGGNTVVTRLRSEPSRQIANGHVAPAADEPEEVEEVETESDFDTPTPRAKAAKKPAKVVPASILQDVRLDDVTPTFKDFATEKAPPSDMAKYLVVAYWFKFHKGISNLTSNHFYTAYKMMGWKVPRDPVQPARELRAGRDGRFSTGTDAGTFMINQVGENSVTEMGS